MNKNKILIIALFIILIICGIGLGILISYNKKLKNNDIDKEETTILLDCESNSIVVNKSVKCTIKGNSKNYKVSSLTSKIENSNNFSITDVKVDSSWQGDGEDNYITLYTDEYRSGTFNIATFVVSLVNDNVDEITINLIDNSFGDENFEEYNLANVTKTLKVRK